LGKDPGAPEGEGPDEANRRAELFGFFAVRPNCAARRTVSRRANLKIRPLTAMMIASGRSFLRL
jgi:hypothetical protein